MPAKGHSPSPTVDTQVTGKKRKRNLSQGEKGLVQTRPQEWPFGPSGDSRTQRMDVSYRIEPLKGWLDMTRYKINNVKYYSDDFVYVANDMTVERQTRANEDPDQPDTAGLKGHWVARVLEIRALDEHHVYARVYWMYSADDLLPKSTADQGPIPEQLADYSQNELMASNHMDIIDVLSVVGRVSVNHACANATEGEGGLHWQWAFDYRTSKLSSITPFKDDLKEARLPYKAAGDSPNKIKSAEPACLLTDVAERESAGPAPTNNLCLSNRAESGVKVFVERLASQRVGIGLLGNTLCLNAAYQHALKVMDRQVLRKHQWDDAESLELNRFIAELRAIQEILPARINPTKPLDILLRSIANIRHNAVHRRKVSMEGVEQCLLDATEFAALLGDFQCVENISILRREVLYGCGKIWTIAEDERKLQSLKEMRE
ncbi:duf455 domain protein [Purpureocillium lavendulum]|uniref:Duf455 domain protein n=1 Tax=Purpureocillium lavendulum TaxID=1247861 RepID=A0AB34FEB0_9HYPO|nr:duf455 domain protein [Purpureocillium lavendulum]